MGDFSQVVDLLPGDLLLDAVLLKLLLATTVNL